MPKILANITSAITYTKAQTFQPDSSATAITVTGHSAQATDLINFQSNDASSYLRFSAQNAAAGIIGLDIKTKSVATSGLNSGFRAGLVVTPATAASGGYWNIITSQTTGTQNFTDNVIGLIVHGQHASTGTSSGASSSITGISGKAFTDSGSGAVDRAIGASTHVTANGGTITDGIGLRVYNGDGTGAITNMYGIKIEDITKGGTLNYSLYTGTAPSYFGGEVQDTRGTFANEGLYWMD